MYKDFVQSRSTDYGMVQPDGLFILTIQQWLTGQSDVFTPVVPGYSIDVGQTWSKLEDPDGAFAYIPGNVGFETGMCNFKLCILGYGKTNVEL